MVRICSKYRENGYRRVQIMKNSEELKDLGRVLALTSNRLEKAGCKIIIWPCEYGMSFDIEPFTICDTCNRWSPADKCLWCDDEFHGEGVA